MQCRIRVLFEEFGIVATVTYRGKIGTTKCYKTGIFMVSIINKTNSEQQEQAWFMSTTKANDTDLVVNQQVNDMIAM